MNHPGHRGCCEGWSVFTMATCDGCVIDALSSTRDCEEPWTIERVARAITTQKHTGQIPGRSEEWVTFVGRDELMRVVRIVDAYGPIYHERQQVPQEEG